MFSWQLIELRRGLVSLLEFPEFIYGEFEILHHHKIHECPIILEHPKILLKTKGAGIPMHSITQDQQGLRFSHVKACPFTAQGHARAVTFNYKKTL